MFSRRMNARSFFHHLTDTTRKLVGYFYSPRTGSQYSAVDRWKEEWTLCSFAERYNRYHRPALVWARRNPRGTHRADFSVCGRDRFFLCDIEVTSVWSTPTVKDPHGYEDFCPYPTWMDPSHPDVRHIDIDRPPKSPPYGTLKRIVTKHLRDHYPSYWLVIWDNEHAVRHPNLDDLAVRVKKILAAKKASGRLPTSLQHVWVFDENDPEPRQVLS